jgi:hypothetical protein
VLIFSEIDVALLVALGFPAQTFKIRRVDPRLHGGVGVLYRCWPEHLSQAAACLGLPPLHVAARHLAIVRGDYDHTPFGHTALAYAVAMFDGPLLRDLALVLDEASLAWRAGGAPAVHAVLEPWTRGRVAFVASSDWQAAVGSLSAGNALFTVTTGTTKPNGGGNFARVAHSLTNVVGARADYVTQAGFAPMASGCDQSGAVARMTSGGATGWSCFLFNSLGGTSVNDECYMLGLTDTDPAFIALRKGPLVLGLPDEDAGGASNILLIGTVPVEIDEWVHLRLETVVQPFGDAYLNCYQSDLGANTVGSPVWEEIPGMELGYNDLAVSFIDDALGINTGSAPYVGGRAGWGFRVEDVTRRCGFDHFRVARQTAP